MKREKIIKSSKSDPPRRVIVAEKEAIKPMKDFSKRKEQFIATARTGKDRSVHA